MGFQDAPVAVEPVLPVGDDGKNTRPGDVAAVERPVGRGNIGLLAVGVLIEEDVVNPLVVERGHVEVESLTLAVYRHIATPALAFIAVGIQRDASAHEHALPPAHIAINLVQQWNGALEGAYMIE